MIQTFENFNASTGDFDGNLQADSLSSETPKVVEKKQVQSVVNPPVRNSSGPVNNVMGNIESQRAMQEIQAQVLLAKKFPREESYVLSRILQACKRKHLAEEATFAYPRGGELVTGPSIRLAEEIARHYGNLDYGVKELEQRETESVVQAYCWDLETNVRQIKTFTVKHERHTKKGTYRLKDPRDIYENNANNGARRLRACILGVVPQYIVEEALNTCEQTLKEQDLKAPITDTVGKLLANFAEIGVTKDMIVQRLGRGIETFNHQDILEFRKIFVSLKQNMSGLTDWFGVKNEEKKESKLKEMVDKKGETQ